MCYPHHMLQQELSLQGSQPSASLRTRREATTIRDHSRDLTSPHPPRYIPSPTHLTHTLPPCILPSTTAAAPTGFGHTATALTQRCHARTHVCTVRRPGLQLLLLRIICALLLSLTRPWTAPRARQPRRRMRHAPSRWCRR